MLSQFSIRNYKSIWDSVTLDMQPAETSDAPSGSNKETELPILQNQDGELFLPVSVIYGPNGSGKSNLLEALQTAVHMVLAPTLAVSGEEIPKRQIRPFAFEKEDTPTEFTLFFQTKEAEYRYFLQWKNGKILVERLDQKKPGEDKSSVLFTRDQSKIFCSGPFAKIKASTELSENLSLLSYLGILYPQNKGVKDVLSWFQEKILFAKGNLQDPQKGITLLQSPLIRESVKNLLLEMDLDIRDFRIDPRKKGYDAVYTKHVLNGRNMELSFAEESRGIQNLFQILPFLADSLLHGKTLVIDNLDEGLHPLLVKKILSLYRDPKSNPKNAQLLFTTQETYLLHQNILRKDEVWFTAKDQGQSTVLYSLAEFKEPSKELNESYEQHYLDGEYGAVPYDYC